MLNRFLRLVVGLSTLALIIPLMIISLIGWVITDEFLLIYIVNWVLFDEWGSN